MANEGLAWDPLQKYDNLGGDWNPGQGDNSSYMMLILQAIFFEMGTTRFAFGVCRCRLRHQRTQVRSKRLRKKMS